MPRWPAPFPVWEGGSLQGGRELRSSVPLNLARFPSREGATRSHTGTGLLIGGLVGAAVTTVFLIGFCSDPDTSCQADEVGRAALVFAVPAAAVGALIGWLVRTES